MRRGYRDRGYRRLIAASFQTLAIAIHRARVRFNLFMPKEIDGLLATFLFLLCGYGVAGNRKM